MTEQSVNDNGPIISWPQLATAASILATGSLASLIIVLALKDTDALATVALSLAIVTFITQILVFVAQTWTTSQLNAETRGFLQELQTSAHGTEKALNAQVDKLTDHLLHSFESARKREDLSAGPGLRERVREDVAEALSVTRPLVTDVAASDSRVGASREDRRIAEELITFPAEEEGVELLKALRSLSPITVANLRAFAEDERVSRQLGGEPGLHLASDHPFSKEAIEAGLLEYDPSDHEWARLTEKGRQIARLFLGLGDPPSWMRQE